MEAQWDVWQNQTGSNGQRRCSGTGPGTRGTGPREEAGPPPPRSPGTEKHDQSVNVRR